MKPEVLLPGLREWVCRLWGTLRPNSRDRDLKEELALHLDHAEEELRHRGHSPEEASRLARVQWGGSTQAMETLRDQRTVRWLDNLALDTRLGLRMMRKSWGLTLIGGLAMAVAIGVGAAAFAVLETYEGDTLPLNEGDRVVRLVTTGPSRGSIDNLDYQYASIQDFEWWRDQMQTVEDISAFGTTERLLVAEDGSDGLVSVARMTSSGFRVARVQPFMGRPLLEEDERDNAPPVVVIGYEVWQSRLAGDPAAVGQTVQLGGLDHVVVGVMPEDFAFPLNHQVWTPLRTLLGDPRPTDADVVVLGRLAPGVTIESAQAEITVVGPAPVESPDNEEALVRVAPYANSFLQAPLWWDVIPLLLALLLIPPCANIAILIHARNVSRQEEFAARFVLGAGRGRIVGQLSIEAFVLAAAAGGAGLVLADQFLLRVFESEVAQSPAFPFWIEPNISFETVLYIAGLAAFAAVVAGGLPALRATGRMRQSGFHALGSSRVSPRLGMTWTVLVVTQVALATAALPGAGEQLWAMFNPNLIAREFAAEEYVTARIVLEDEQTPGAPVPSDGRFADFRDLQVELVRQVQADLGISGVTVSASIDGIDDAFRRIETDVAGQESFLAEFNQVDEAYFGVYEASLHAGRGFETADFNPGRPVVIVNTTFAERLSGQNPLGKRVRYISSGESDLEPGPWYEIVGIVDQISANTQRANVYHPLMPGEIQRANLTLRVGPRVPSGFAHGLAGIATALDPDLQVERLRTLDDLYQQEFREDNTMGLIMATPVLIVLLFSMAGIHTLVAFAVAQRRREIGLRSALGASPSRLVGDVFRRDLFPVVGGAIVGALLAFPVDKLIPRNTGLPVTNFSVFAALMIIVAIGLLAVSGPARRVLRVEATEALRES